MFSRLLAAKRVVDPRLNNVRVKTPFQRRLTAAVKRTRERVIHVRRYPYVRPPLIAWPTAQSTRHSITCTNSKSRVRKIAALNQLRLRYVMLCMWCIYIYIHTTHMFVSRLHCSGEPTGHHVCPFCCTSAFLSISRMLAVGGGDVGVLCCCCCCSCLAVICYGQSTLTAPCGAPFHARRISLCINYALSVHVRAITRTIAQHSHTRGGECAWQHTTTLNAKKDEPQGEEEKSHMQTHLSTNT